MKKAFGVLIVIFGVLFSSILLISAKKQKDDLQPSDNKKYDLDFTKMNFNMASGITFDILIDPEKYENKTVKIYGQFMTSVHDGKRTYSIVVWDNTSCCPTGLSLLPENPSAKYPADFPKAESFVTASGKMGWVNHGADDEQMVLWVEEW